MENLLIPIFKVGTFTDVKGKTNSYTVESLREIENEYLTRQPGNRAKIVIGHPEKEKGLGEVLSVKVYKDKLWAFAGNINPDFLKAIKAGSYRTVSVKLQGNKLIHVGFLGAMPPAVKGLGDTVIISNDNQIQELGLTLDSNAIYSENDIKLFSMSDLTEDNLKGDDSLEDNTNSDNIDSESILNQLKEQIQILKEKIKENNIKIKELEAGLEDIPEEEKTAKELKEEIDSLLSNLIEETEEQGAENV